MGLGPGVGVSGAAGGGGAGGGGGLDTGIDALTDPLTAYTLTITGTATGGGTISAVELTIEDGSNGLYWDGYSWRVAETWVFASNTGTEFDTWEYVWDDIGVHSANTVTVTARAYDGAYDATPATDTTVVTTDVIFKVDFYRNGMTDYTDVAESLVAPTFFWTADDPLVYTGSAGSGTLSWVGTPASAINTPLCTDGSFSDLTATDCQGALQFDGGTVGYLKTDDTTSRWAGGDITVVVVGAFDYSSVAPANSTAVSIRDTTADQGWDVNIDGATCELQIRATSTDTAQAAQPIQGALGLCGFHYDGTGDDGAAFDVDLAAGAFNTIGSYTPAGEELVIGALGDGSRPFNGQISMVMIWDGTEYPYNSTPGARDIVQGLMMGPRSLMGGTEPMNVFGAATGQGLWHGKDTLVQHGEYSALGANVPPGRAGDDNLCEGMLITGRYASQNWANDLLYSVDFSAGAWVETGTGVITADTTGTPWQDGRVVTKLTDDDGAASEYVSQTFTCGNAAKLIQIYGKSLSGTQAVDISVTEQTVCAGNTTHYAAKEVIAGEFTELFWTHTTVDNTCTECVLTIAPVSGTGVDYLTASDTATAIAVLPTWYDDGQTHPPPFYLATAGTAFQKVGDIPRWTANSEPADISPSATGNNEFHTEMAYFFDQTVRHYPTGSRISNVGTGGSSSRLLIENGNGTGNFSLVVNNTEVGNGALTFTPGVVYDFTINADYDADIYTLDQDGVEIVSDGANTFTAPTGWVSLYLYGDSQSDNGLGLCYKSAWLVTP